MKRLRLISILSTALLFSANADAQLFSGDNKGIEDSTAPKMEFGLKAGVNMQAVRSDLWLKDRSTGILGGMFFQMHKNKIAGSAEVLLTTARFTSIPLNDTNGTVQPLRDSVGNVGDFRATSINIPVLVKYYVIPWLSINAGIQYSNLVSVSNLNDFKPDVRKIFKTGSFSAVAGIEATLPLKIIAGARYVHGLSDINNTTISNMPGSWTTNAIQLYVGYRIK